MRGLGIPALVCAGLIAVGCGGDSSSSTATARPTTPEVSTSVASGIDAPDVPHVTDKPERSTTAPPTSGTPATQPGDADLVVLRADGLGAVDFGTPAEDTVAALTEHFGVPDIDETEDAPLGGYDYHPAIERWRQLVWHRQGLSVALTDWGGSRSASPVPLHLAMWTVKAGPEAVEAATLRTAEGLGIGATAAELRAAAPDTRLGWDVNVTFTADLPGGPLRGRFDWPEAALQGEPAAGFYRALQAALNDHGADLELDGIWGPRTARALVEYAETHGIDGAVVRDGRPMRSVPLFTAWWHLGLPPDHVRINYLHAGDDEVASQPPSSEPPRAILRSDGLGPVDLGTPADDAIPILTDLLGPPDRDIPIPPGSECISGVVWLDCLSASSVIEEGRLLEWNSLALEVVFVDSRVVGSMRVRAPLNLETWRASAPALTTVEGLHPGMTFGQARPLSSSVEGRYDEGFLGAYGIAMPGGGGYHGGLDPDPSTVGHDHTDQIRAIQAALNTHGADLVVDGIWGPRSETAWINFLQQHSIEPAAPTFAAWLIPEIGEALGLPTDEMTITSMSPTPP